MLQLMGMVLIVLILHAPPGDSVPIPETASTTISPANERSTETVTTTAVKLVVFVLGVSVFSHTGCCFLVFSHFLD